jgi:hypothetical protein
MSSPGLTTPEEFAAAINATTALVEFRALLDRVLEPPDITSDCNRIFPPQEHGGNHICDVPLAFEPGLSPRQRLKIQILNKIDIDDLFSAAVHAIVNQLYVAGDRYLRQFEAGRLDDLLRDQAIPHHLTTGRPIGSGAEPAKPHPHSPKRRS